MAHGIDSDLNVDGTITVPEGSVVAKAATMPLAASYNKGMLINSGRIWYECQETATGVFGWVKTAQKTLTVASISLSKTGWDADKKQSVPLDGIDPNDTDVLFVSPSIADFEEYGDCRIRAIEVTAGHVKFQCEDVPEHDLGVEVAYA